jgi:hypothetical protein
MIELFPNERKEKERKISASVIRLDLFPTKISDFSPWLVNAIALRTLEQVHGSRNTEAN